MASGRGKGRISSELVAASCAAVLAVYAAGYWRTREAARRIDDRTQERHPVRAAGPSAEAPASLPPPAPEVPDVAVPQKTTPTAAVKSSPERDVDPAASKASSAPAIAATSDAGAAAPSASVEPALQLPPQPPPAPAGKWRDGTYTGWGTSRHGDIKSQVVIRDGRIVEASIASCETRYPCDVIGDIIAQPVARQSPEVDRVSRATESADAYYFGLVEALKEALVPADGPTAASP